MGCHPSPGSHVRSSSHIGMACAALRRGLAAFLAGRLRALRSRRPSGAAVGSGWRRRGSGRWFPDPVQPLQPLEVVSRYVSVGGPPSCLAGAERSQVPSRGGAREGDGDGAASAALLCGVAQGAARGDLQRDLPGVARGGVSCCTLIRVLHLLLSRLFCGSICTCNFSLVCGLGR